MISDFVERTIRSAREKGVLSVTRPLRRIVPRVLFETKCARWDARDLDTLTVLAENIGLALMYTRLFRVVNEIKGVMDDIHPIWMQPPPGD